MGYHSIHSRLGKRFTFYEYLPLLFRCVLLWCVSLNFVFLQLAKVKHRYWVFLFHRCCQWKYLSDYLVNSMAPLCDKTQHLRHFNNRHTLVAGYYVLMLAVSVSVHPSVCCTYIRPSAHRLYSITKYLKTDFIQILHIHLYQQCLTWDC